MVCLIKSFLYNCQTWLRKKKSPEYRPYLFYLATTIVVYLPRDKDIDKPQIVFLSLIGNDVCNGRYPTEPHFTTEEEFRTKTLQTLDHLGLVSNTMSWPFVTWQYLFSFHTNLHSFLVIEPLFHIFFLKTIKTKYCHLDPMLLWLVWLTVGFFGISCHKESILWVNTDLMLLMKMFTNT